MATTGTPRIKFNPFGGIRGTKYGLIFGCVLALVIAMAIVLFLGITFCLTPIIAAIVLYFVPTYFGFKSKPKLALVGLVFLVIIGLAVGLVAASAQDALASQTLHNDQFINGQVTPFRSSPGSYTFTATLVAAGHNSTPTVKLRLLDTWSGADNLYAMNFNNTTGLCTVTESLGASVYFHSFVYVAPDGTVYATDWGNGPVTTTGSEIYNHNVGLGMLITFYLIGVLFYMLILLTWWMDSSKKKFEKQQAERKKNTPQAGPAAPAGASKKEKFVCSECGAEVPIDADKCPQCGERFEEETPRQKAIPAPAARGKPEEFVCSECGKTVKADDKKCWNCGKEFDE